MRPVPFKSGWCPPHVWRSTGRIHSKQVANSKRLLKMQFGGAMSMPKIFNNDEWKETQDDILKKLQSKVQYQVADSSCTVSEWSSAFCGKVIKTTAMLQKKLEAMVSKYGMESMPKLPKADCHLISWKRKRNKCSGTQGKRTKKRKILRSFFAVVSNHHTHLYTKQTLLPQATTSNHKQQQATSL